MIKTNDEIMRKFVIAIAFLICAVGFSSCSGTQSVASGTENRAGICVSANSEFPIVVTIDDQAYETQTLKNVGYNSRRDIRKTAKRAIPTTSGRHKVEVKSNGESLYSKEVMLSKGETKIIRL